MKTENQLLKDRNIQPTTEIIALGLGKANSTFVKFVNEIKLYGITLMDWRYYNDGKAWLSKGEYRWVTARGTNKVKPIFWLSIWEGFFKVSFFFGASVLDELVNLPISETTKELIKNAQLGGKQIQFIPVIFDIEDETLLNDVYELAKFRKIKIK